VERRLAAILAADVVGYSRLIRVDEEGTLLALRELHDELIDPEIAKHRGRIVKLMGDGILAEFASVVDAVACSAEVQKALIDRNADLPQARKIVFRIGVNLGDVVIDGDDIHGDGVNVAARLEALSEPNGMCISSAVHEQVRDRLDLLFEDHGDQEVKNIDRPVRVWKWSVAGSASAIDPVSEEKSLPLPEKPSIAALPFDNMSGDPEQEYFADGITEDIITDLSKVSSLFVIARNSSFAYKGQSPDVRKVCSELGVRYVLEGSVRKAGSKVRISAQLIDGSTGGHLWAERYDRDLEDIFAVQDEVTGEIVAALNVALTTSEQTRREDPRKVNPDAYDCLVRARACLLQFTENALIECRAMLKNAIALDPDFAPAYANLALVQCVEFANGWNGAGPDHLTKALELAHKALAADENEPQAHHALALANMWMKDLGAAAQAAERAIELDPNFAGAYTVLGSVRDYAGQHDSAVTLLQQAIRLDPQHDLAVQFLGRAEFSLKRYDEAEATFKRRLVHRPQSDATRVFLASVYGHTGRHEEARRVWCELLEINPDFSLEHFQQVLPYKDPEWFNHFLEGLRKSGLPE